MARLADYLCEELALGDLDESIDTMKMQMAQAGASAEEKDFIFQTIVALQKDAIARRKAHKPLI